MNIYCRSVVSKKAYVQDTPTNYNLVPEVHGLLGQLNGPHVRLWDNRKIYSFSIGHYREEVVLNLLLWDKKCHFPRVPPGDQPLTKEAEYSGQEIALIHSRPQSPRSFWFAPMSSPLEQTKRIAASGSRNGTN